MTSEAPAPRVSEAPEPPPKSARRDSVIDEQLQKTQRQVKGVDIAAGLLTLGISVIAYLFVLALADHWLVAGGLGFYTRLLALLVLGVGGGAYAYFQVMRPLIQKINPVFVAHTIEESRPSLKNSLVNFLLLRSGPHGEQHGLSTGVYQAVEGRAADDLAQVSPEAVVDRRHVVWLASVFVVLIAVGGIYHIASPKSPLTSVARIAWPWTATAAPTRVTISDITPGDTVAFHGQTITVSAEVSGAAAGEAVTLFFDTADGQSVGEAVPMRLPEGGYRYRCELPPGKLGLQQDLQYYIGAGDCKSQRYNVTVETPPVIEVERIDYEYPAYTGIADRSAERMGDIRAIEGTQITVFAKANRPIQQAEIDLNCDGLRGLRMSIDGDKAKGGFKLRMRPGDATQPEHDCYLLRFHDEEGRENRQPIRYDIEVIADLPPVVRLVEPPQDHIQLPLNGSLPLQIEAEDPDFALSKVTIRVEKAGRGVPTRAILNKASSEEPHKGPFAGTYSFEPAKLGLKTGDQVVYWAEASDNKSPLANVSETERRWITIVEPSDDQQKKDEQQQDPKKQDESGKGEKQDGKSGEQQKPDQKQEQQEGKGQEGEGQEGEGQEGQDQKGEGQEGQGQEGQDQKGEGQQQDGQKGEGQQQSDQPSEPIDGESNPGDVFDKALEHMKNQEEKQKDEQGEQKEGKQKEDEGKQDAQQKPSEEKQGEEQDGQRKPGEEKQGEEQDGQRKPGEEKQGEEQDGQRKPGEEKQGEEQDGQQKPGEDKQGEKQDGQQKPGEDKQGEKQDGQQKPGEDKQGEKQDGQQKPGEDKQGEKQDGQQKLGEEKQGEKQDGQQKPGEEKQGEKQDGQQKPGEDKQGEKQDGQQKPGEEKQGEKQDGQQKPGEDKQGEKQDGQQKPGEDKQGEKQDGQQKPDEDKQGEKQDAQQKPGEEKQGEKQDGQQKPGEDKQGEKQDGQQKPGEEKQGEKQDGQQKPGEEKQGEKQDGQQKPGEDKQGEKQDGQQKPGEDKQGEKQDGQQKPGEEKQGEEKDGKKSDTEKKNGEGKDGEPSGDMPSDQASANEPLSEAENEAAEEFNKDYADKATDLVLDEFEKQLAKQKPDQELLDSLGWSREDLERFTKRWRAMKRAAKESGSPRAKHDLDEALRSLGLGPSQTKIGGGTKSDDMQGLREFRRIAPPKKWARQIEATKRSIGSKTGPDRP